MGTEPEMFKLRRVVADGTNPCIPFHTDVCSARTMQIPLNDDSEYYGGRLVLVTEQGMGVPPRKPGSATIHTAGVVHGVTRLRGGTRYSFFLALRPGGGEEVDLQHLVQPALVCLPSQHKLSVA